MKKFWFWYFEFQSIFWGLFSFAYRLKFVKYVISENTFFDNFKEFFSSLPSLAKYSSYWRYFSEKSPHVIILINFKINFENCFLLAIVGTWNPFLIIMPISYYYYTSASTKFWTEIDSNNEHEFNTYSFNIDI